MTVKLAFSAFIIVLGLGFLTAGHKPSQRVLPPLSVFFGIVLILSIVWNTP